MKIKQIRNQIKQITEQIKQIKEQIIQMRVKVRAKSKRPVWARAKVRALWI